MKTRRGTSSQSPDEVSCQCGIGLGRHTAAQELLEESTQTLQDMGSEGAGPLSEARIYLALSTLTQPSTSDVESLEPLLLEVCSLSSSLHHWNFCLPQSSAWGSAWPTTVFYPKAWSLRVIKVGTWDSLWLLRWIKLTVGTKPLTGRQWKCWHLWTFLACIWWGPRCESIA